MLPLDRTAPEGVIYDEGPHGGTARPGPCPPRRNGRRGSWYAWNACADGAARRDRADGTAVWRSRPARLRPGGGSACSASTSRIASGQTAVRSWWRRIRWPTHGYRWPRRACRRAAPLGMRSSIVRMASPPPNSSSRSMRRARWRARSDGLSASCRGFARCACIWCCRAASRSRAISRSRRPA